MGLKSKASSVVCMVMLTIASASLAAPIETIDLADIQPNDCPGPFTFDSSTKGCKGDSAKLAKIKSAPQCDSSGLHWDDKTATCTFLKNQEPKPGCGNRLPDLAVKDGKCVVQRDTPRSASGNYVGDCFTVIATPLPNPLKFDAGEKLVVLSQRDDGEDKLLNVAAAKLKTIGPMNVPYFCDVAGSEIKSVRASDLSAAGAERLGWTYGVLALPFKYYRDDHSFGAGASLGPYIGRRSGAAGSATTFAAAATIGAVKGEIKDATGNITGTPDLLAFSVAVGVMYDISKAPGVTPFKVGLFIGQDRVSKDKAVSYKQNGKGWVAFQIGFDFTDN